MSPPGALDRDPDAALRRLVDEARADGESQERIRRRWLRQQAEEEAEFAGTLLALLERGATVTLGSQTGRRHTGRLVGLGRDVCALELQDARRVWLRLDALETVRPEPALDAPPASDARMERQDLELVEVLARLVDERPSVRLVTRGSPEPVSGELRSVGADVATLREGGRGTTCYVRLPSVVEISVLDSG
jgi:hypothetical protein